MSQPPALAHPEEPLAGPQDRSAQVGSSVTMWVFVLMAALIMLIVMGIRQTVGLFVLPISHTTAIGIAEMSMALAIGQLTWGVLQPLFGAWADKKSAFAVLCVGAVLMAVGQLGAIFVDSAAGLTLMLGILSPGGSAAGSFAVIIGIVAARIPTEKRSVVSGLINAGGSGGQFAFAPLVQLVMNLRGYQASLVFLAGAALLTILPAWALNRLKNRLPLIKTPPPARSASTRREAFRPEAFRPAPLQTFGRPESLKEQLALALKDPSYLLLHAGFFTCGFHVAFLTTHLPGEVSLCGHSAAVSATSLSLIGLCNIAGSIGAGVLGKYFRMKYILAALYASRAVMIAIYIASPKTELTFYVFAAATGLTWLATIPPTAGLVGKMFGMRYLATLFGLTFLTHQLGAFLGAWLGGVAMEQTGNLLWVWYLDVTLAGLAALVNLPIREARVER